MELIAYSFFLFTLKYIKNFHLKFLIILYIVIMLIDKNFSAPNMNDNILSCLNFFISGSIVYFLSMKLKKSHLLFFL